MAYNVKSTLAVLQSHMARTGYTASTQIGEPASPPDVIDKVHAAIYMVNAGPRALTMFRVVDMVVPLVVDGSATTAA